MGVAHSMFKNSNVISICSNGVCEIFYGLLAVWPVLVLSFILTQHRFQIRSNLIIQRTVSIESHPYIGLCGVSLVVLLMCVSVFSELQVAVYHRHILIPSSVICVSHLSQVSKSLSIQL